MSKFVSACFLLALVLSIGIISQLGVFGQSGDFEFLGFAGYITSQTELENTIALMQSQNLNAYRVSFKPSWQVPEGEVRGYNSAYIDYLLANTNFFIIVDGNHLYPGSEASAQDARDHWTEMRNRIFQTLEKYPNNTRVAVELINEYASDDYGARMQALIDEIRNVGYTNPIVTNKLHTVWQKLSDPLNNTYQGMHFYFNTWDTTRAMNQMNIAQSRGIAKLLNTEVGASSGEYKLFNQTSVDALESFLSQSQALGVNNCIWMNNDTINWQGYTQYSFTFNPPPTPTPSPTPDPTPSPTPTPTPSPTATPSPTPLPMLFADSFESNNFNLWSRKGGLGTHSETVETRNPQQGRYNARFNAGSRSESWAYKNLLASPVLYFQQHIQVNILPTSGNRLFLGTIYANSRNSMELYIANSRGRYYWGVCSSINGRNYYNMEVTASNPKIGNYYAVEMCRDSIDDRSKLWVDGTLKIDVSRLHIGNAYRVYSGITGTNTRTVAYVDNIKVATSYIG